MEKLELKHIVGYLPYGLKVQLLDRKVFTKRIVVGCTYKGILRIGDNGHGNYEAYFDKVKPILRPLSDLTKEIEVDGEKFVPVVELSKIHEIAFHYPIECKSSGSVHKCVYSDLDNKKKVFNFCGYNNSFVVYENPNMDIYKTENQLELFEKLYELHFDIHGLIEKGLAIDINTLDNGIQ